MKTVQDLEESFFADLRKFNITNYRALKDADLSKNDARTHKAFSSVLTRYFIFREKHGDEFTQAEYNMLFFQLKLDLIGDYFAHYPESDTSALTAFQEELRRFLKERSSNKEASSEESVEVKK